MEPDAKKSRNGKIQNRIRFAFYRSTVIINLLHEIYNILLVPEKPSKSGSNRCVLSGMARIIQYRYFAKRLKNRYKLMLAKHSGMGVGLCPIGQFNVFTKQLWQDILTSYDNVQVSGPR